MIVYVNGQWMDDSMATVSFQDRAFVFADAVYEVMHIYNGRYFKLELHLERMRYGLDKLRIPFEVDNLKSLLDELLQRNSGVTRGSLYIQISRGEAPRALGLPKLKEPTIVAYIKPFIPDTKKREQGGRAIFVEDLRWQMCNIKTTGILLNCMAKEEALERGSDDAIFHRGEIVTEASSSNLFIVKNGTLLTHPQGPWVLPGITRHVVMELSRTIGIPVREEQFTKSDLLSADELFLTGTLIEVVPYVEVDGMKIGNGGIGLVTCKIQEAFRKEADIFQKGRHELNQEGTT